MSDILSPMSGNIWKVLVKEGDKVKAGDELMVMEVMKMEMPITADKAGVVKSLKVKEEDSVEAGAVVAVIG